MINRLLLILFICCLSACGYGGDGGPDPSLTMYLKGIELDCNELMAWDFTKGFLVKKELDGWGVLIISKNNEPDKYDLSLVSHLHERVFETREIQCAEL